MYSMKTTLNIPDEQMEALLKVTHAKNRTEAVNTAIVDYIHRKNIDAVLALEGSGGFVNPEKLDEIRALELTENDSIQPPSQ